MLKFRAQIASFWQSTDARARRLILGLILAVVVLLVCVLSTAKGSPTVSDINWQATQPATSGAPSTPASQLQAQTMVHVVGEVLNPGVYQLPANSRVLDAVFAAGGFTKAADRASINLARLVNDGEQILVLARGTQSSGLTATHSGLVNLNFADASQLDAIPGIGPTLAQRIVDYRMANGGFTSLGDLGKVTGFGPSLLGKLANLVTF